MAAAQLTLQSLGRMFTLGSLYNNKTGEIIHGIKIFTDQELEKMIHRRSNDSMESEFVKENSLSDKAENLDVSGQLSLSLLCGAITASGSGKYLTDSKKTSKTESVTFQVKSKTVMEEIFLPQEVKVKVSQSCGATHVVTAIQYGGTALFTFEMNKSDSNKNEDTSGELKGEIKKLVTLSGSANMALKAADKEASEKIRVIYQGDFHLDSPPINLNDAIECIKKIKSQDAKSPVTVTLTPLCSLMNEEVPREQAPLPKSIIEGVHRAYEYLNNALGTCDAVAADLRPTMWFRIAIELNEAVVVLRNQKTALDEIVKSLLHNETTDKALVKLSKAEKLSMILWQWSQAVLDASGVLLVIAEEFKLLKLEAICSKKQKTKFLFKSSGAKKLFGVSISVSKFSAKSLLENTDQFKKEFLWENEEEENQFHLQFRQLKENIEENMAATQQSDSSNSSDSEKSDVAQIYGSVEHCDFALPGTQSMTLKEFQAGAWTTIKTD